MLTPQLRSDFLLPPEWPPVFGKPWYWLRSRGTVESTRSLAQVIVEMQEEIKHSAAARRAEQSFGDFFPGPPGMSPMGGLHDAVIENPYANLRRNASASALDLQYKENTVMTVRRYSISSNMPPGVNGREGTAIDSRRSDPSGWGRLQEEVRHGSSSRLELEQHTEKRSLKDLVHKNRAKVKTVTFLLPVDDIYTNRPVLTKHLEDSRTTELDSRTTELDSRTTDLDSRTTELDSRTKELDSITETDY
ncbi:hypothetical protein NHX12_008219 [Muraenolepis orangiensis]|uniref:Uncharacterized protein n=1 Tax=Muraenolepis orangiensis TaxID=630683 RepID=A0A9Q0DKB9_9TELE|nr:hypothetical protein NHX12_008219 [Muraenolepis orangiensis]